MLKQYKKRLFALLLCAVFSFSLMPAALAEPAPEDGEAPTEEVPSVVIQTAEDLLAFSRNCALDTWSQGRTVTLTADIDLAGVDFSPIPTFGGTFDGQGHTISGLHLTGDGSAIGLFRYVQAGGTVTHLCVRGIVAPGGTPAQAGGIAGVNRGRLADCVFEGTVRGEEQVGGIAGYNDLSGEISACRAAGHITGTRATGGIAGQNDGVLLKCRSDAQVNTAGPDATRSLQDIASTVSAAMLTEGETVSEEADDTLNSHTDTGGIAGMSGGVVQGCVNTGIVGYPHVGYNVGGIVGRQNGYMEGCTNQGAVYGRKDVGGITGQAEPDIVLRTGEDMLENLRRELNQLDRLVTRAVNDSDAQGNTISARLASIGSYTGSARDHTNTLLNHVSDFVDGNLHEIDSFSTAVTTALDHMARALDEMTGISSEIGRVCDELSAAIDDGLADGSIPPEEAEGLRADIQHLRDAGRQMEAACDAVSAAIRKLQNAVTITNPEEDPTAVQDALKELADTMSALGSAVSEAAPALSHILEALKDSRLPEFSDEDLDTLTAALDALGDAAQRAADALKVLSDNTHFDWDSVQDGLSGIDSAFASMADAASLFSSACRSLAQGAADGLSDLSKRFERTFRALGEAVDTLRAQGPVKLTPLGDEVRTASSNLYTSLGSISSEMSTLRQEVDSTRSSLSGNVLAISRQFNVVTNCLVDMVSEVQGLDFEHVITDISDEDIDSIRLGKVERCVNTAPVDGDRNVGGIVGAMAIEYDLDPEDDLTRFTLGSTYETRAVLTGCANRGAVTGKKDCVGGIAGRMDLGAVAGCENYGDIASTSGRYVGGTAGWADSVLRACFSKCVLSGESDVGGIAGWAARMQDCRAIATIDGGSQRLGAIAGNADIESGNILGNRFVDTGWAAVDGVSYAGMAEPVSYEALQADETTPRELITFALTLYADEELVASLPLAYGQALNAVSLPEVPEKDGYFGRWPDFPVDTALTDVSLDAEYLPWIEMLDSVETAESNLPLALAQGRFSDEAALHVTPGSQTPPDGTEGGTVWDVSLTGTALSLSASVPLRLLCGDGAQLWQYADGAWQKAEYTENGQYLLLTMAGLSATYCLVPVEGALIWPWVAAGAAVLAVIVLLILIISRRRAKKAKRRVPEKAGNA